MNLGFETIGNATLICHDREPVLVTDPWIAGDAYFGSWTTSHEIPEEQMRAIERCRFVWVSHGHPDHLSSRSIAKLRGAKMLLPDHAGGRIFQSFREQGYDVQVLKDREWLPLSDRVRVLSISDYNQDAVLLVDLGGTLVINLNDSSDRGWASFVRKTAASFENVYLMRISGYGDADMINFHDEQGRPLHESIVKRNPVGRGISESLKEFGAGTFIPFSSQHRYQRKDSVWANRYTVQAADYAEGFDASSGRLLPQFVRVDCGTGAVTEIRPAERKIHERDPSEFGDDWSEPLEADEAKRLREYFGSIERLGDFLDFINVRAGGKDNVVELATKKFARGITFEAPRGSLMIAVQEEIFDDMLIGNFMKTTLHGSFPNRLADFTPVVAKYADNGRAKTKAELEAYFAEYRRRAPLDYLQHRLARRSISTCRDVLGTDSGVYRLVRGVYRKLRGR
jgi:L-ascorbate metabolism protein UlaG (beta-lactamase superfamily)